MKPADFVMVKSQAEALISKLEEQKTDDPEKSNEQHKIEIPEETNKSQNKSSSIFSACTGGANKGQAPPNCTIM